LKIINSFSIGKASSLIVDSGASKTTIAAIQDGYLIKKSMSSLAGDYLTK